MNTLFTVLFYANQHSLIVLSAMLLGILIGIPLAIISYATYSRRPVFLTLFEKLAIISPLAILIALQPTLGFSFWSTLGLLLYCNITAITYMTLNGLHNTKPKILLSSKSLGLSKRTQIMKVQFPLVLPQMLAGIRFGVLQSITIVTITSYFGTSGLGVLIKQGLADKNNALLYGTAFMLALMCLIADTIFVFLEKKAGNYFSLKRFRNALPVIFSILMIILFMYWITEYFSHAALLRNSIIDKISHPQT